MPDYLLVNRCAISVLPKSPFWEWVNQADEINEEFIFERANDSNIYLIPDYESETDITVAIEKYLRENFDEIFISELEAWNMDPTTYPQITYDLFREWFDTHSHTMIFDTLKKSLKRQ